MCNSKKNSTSYQHFSAIFTNQQRTTSHLDRWAIHKYVYCVCSIPIYQQATANAESKWWETREWWWLRCFVAEAYECCGWMAEWMWNMCWMSICVWVLSVCPGDRASMVWWMERLYGMAYHFELNVWNVQRVLHVLIRLGVHIHNITIVKTMPSDTAHYMTCVLL